MTETTKSEVEIAESTAEGRLEMAAAEASLDAIGLLNKALRASGMSQKDLAKALGVGESRVSQVLSGDGNVRMTTLARYLRAAGYTLRLDAVPAEENVAELPRPRTRARRRGSTGGQVEWSESSRVGMPRMARFPGCMAVTFELEDDIRNDITFGEPALSAPNPVLGLILSQTLDADRAGWMHRLNSWHVVDATTTATPSERDVYADNET